MRLTKRFHDKTKGQAEEIRLHPDPKSLDRDFLMQKIAMGAKQQERIRQEEKKASLIEKREKSKKLTKRTVETAGVGLHWDDGLHGFGLRVSETGVRSYLVKLASGTRGRSRWLTVGQHGAPWIDADGRPCTLTCDLARVEALRLLGERSRGNDPAAARARARRLPLFRDFADRYISEAGLHKKPRSVAEDRGNLDRVLLPALGSIRIDQLTRSDVQKLHSARSSTPTNANRCLALLSHMMNTAEKWGLRPDGSNPCRHVQRYKEVKRKRFLSPAEIARLAKALTLTFDPYVKGAIKLFLFTGARRNEILSLRWEHVDLDRGVLNLTDSKTGPKPIILNAPAAKVLQHLPRLAGNPYVFPGRRRGTHLVELGWESLREKAGIPGVRVHDLRHTNAAILVSTGASLPVIGGLLGHTSPATTARYAHVGDDPARAAAEAAGAALEEAMKEGAD